jgi:ech hydrogenase subunit D
LIVLEKENLAEDVNSLKAKGYRFAAMTCEQEGENYELTYHFALGYDMKNLRISSIRSEKVKSISAIYPAAFLMENEIQDLYGLEFEGLIIDYKGKLFLSSDGPKTPMNKNNGN